MTLREKYVSPELYTHLFEKFPDRKKTCLEIEMEEFLKFIVLLPHTPPSPTYIPVSKELDLIWHEYILETAEYQRLCESLLGEHGFLHHHSIPYKLYRTTRTEEERQTEHAWWLAAYVATFGEFTAERAEYWTIVHYLIEKQGWSLREVNVFGAMLSREQGIGPFAY